jgi:hypothetical protein
MQGIPEIPAEASGLSHGLPALTYLAAYLQNTVVLYFYSLKVAIIRQNRIFFPSAIHARHLVRFNAYLFSAINVEEHHLYKCLLFSSSHLLCTKTFYGD